MFEKKQESFSKDMKRAPKKSEKAEINALGLKSIEYSHLILSQLESKEDKFDYAQPIMNFRFSAGRVYSKMEAASKAEEIENFSKSLKEYETLKAFMAELRAKKGDEFEMTEGMKEQWKMCGEMCELLPVKLGRLAHELKR